MAMNQGHNSGDLTENEERALFFHHVRKEIAHQAKIKERQEARKADRKLAQADDIVLADIDYAVRAMNAEDKGTITARHLQQSKINFWLGLTSGYQTDFFVDRAPGLERIEKEGERAGYLATERVSPYAKGSDEDESWHRGYDAAQKVMADNLQSAMEKRNAQARDEVIKGKDAANENPFEDEELEAAE
jgi:hypothetical protein